MLLHTLVDLKSFLARGAFFLDSEASEQATILQVINLDIIEGRTGVLP